MACNNRCNKKLKQTNLQKLKAQTDINFLFNTKRSKVMVEGNNKSLSIITKTHKI